MKSSKRSCKYSKILCLFILTALFFVIAFFSAAEEGEGLFRTYLLPKEHVKRSKVVKEEEKKETSEYTLSHDNPRQELFGLSGTFMADMGYKGDKSSYSLIGGKLVLKGEDLKEKDYTIETSLSWYKWGESSTFNLESLSFVTSKIPRAWIRLGRFPIGLSEVGGYASSIDGIKIEWKGQKNNNWSEEYGLIYGKVEGRPVLGGHFSFIKEEGSTEVSGSFLKDISNSYGVSVKTPISKNLMGGINYTSSMNVASGNLWAMWRNEEITVRGAYSLKSQGFNASMGFPLPIDGRGILIYKQSIEQDGIIRGSGDIGFNVPLRGGHSLSLTLPSIGEAGPPDFNLGISALIDWGTFTLSYRGDRDVRVRINKRIAHQWSTSIQGDISGIGIGASYIGANDNHWKGSLKLTGDSLETSIEFNRSIDGGGRASFIFNASREQFYAGVRFTSDISWTIDSPQQLGEVRGQVFYISDPYKPIEGIVLLLDGKERTITDEEGKYSFYGVKEGTHILTIEATSLSARYGPVNGWKQEVKVVGEEAILLDIPVVELASINGRIFIDKNNNFSWDPGEEVSYPITITLEPDGLPCVLRDNGVYSFSGLLPGVYRVKLDKESLGEGYIVRSTPELGVTLSPGEDVHGIDFIIEKVRKPILKRRF